MTLFWIISAILGAGALLYVLRPLLKAGRAPLVSRREANIAIYKDHLRELEADRAAGTLAQADFERSKVELEARLLDDVSAAEAATVPSHGGRMALIVGIAVPVLAIGIYFATGNLAGLNPHMGGAPDAAQVDAMVAKLAAKLRESPDDPEGWKLLGRSYAVMGRYDDAVRAFAQAAERAPRDAQLLADFADVLAMARNQKLDGEPEKLVERALQIDPKNLKALALLGTAAYERKDYARAAEVWGRMLPLVPEGSEDAKMISANVEEARKLAGIGGGISKPAPPQAKAPAKAHPGVRGTVRLADKLKKDVKPEDVVFVFARAAEGPAVPLAVLRARAADLPLQFALDDSMSMAQGMTVSAHSKIVVTARIARSGKPQATAGDLQGASKPVANNARSVDVLIDSVLP